jgi:RNA polymerase sigma-70 factor (ECF subfamily)
MLFLRFRQGDRRALGTLFERLRPYVRALVRAIRGDRRDTWADDSDLFQEAMMQATQAVEGFRGESVGELVRWLRTIVIRTTTRSLRAEDGRHSTEPEESNLATLVVDPRPIPADEAIRHEQSASMAAALSRLPPDMQTVLRGRVMEDRNYVDLSAVLGRSPGAARVLYVRALRRLRDVWNAEFELR